MQIQIIFAFFVYFLVLLSIGLISHRKQTSSADFIVGNRSLSFWLTALSAHASDMSAWLFMAFPAAFFVEGIPALWIAVGLIAGMFLNWQFIAQPLREETEKLHSFTLSTYFERRFKDSSGIIRTLTACMSMIYLSIYLGAGLYAMGLLFTSLFGINYYLGLSIATCVVMTYVFFGGFVTVAWTDFVQGVFLLAVLLSVAFIAYGAIPGWQAIQGIAHTKHIPLVLLERVDYYSILSIFFLVFSWGLGYYGQPHIITKFMGIKSPQEINKAKYLGMAWQILSLGAAALVGLIGIAFFPQGLANPELVFVEIVKSLFSPLMVGFILCGMIAANMSTMDSQILVCASVLSEDFYNHLIKKNATPYQLLKASRWGVIISGIVALLIAFCTNSSILNLVLYAWSGLGSSFGPLVIMSLYDPKANRYGAIGGILIGGGVAGLWPLINPLLTDLMIPTMIPGFFAGLLTIFLLSRLTTRTPALAS